MKRYKSGEYLYRLEKETGFQRKQIKYWAKNEDSFISTSKKQKRKRISGSGPKAKFEEMEKHLFIWFRDEREHKHQVNYTRLRDKAQKIAEEFQILNFVGSNQSPYNFVQVARTGMEQRQWGKKCVQKDNRLPIFYNAKMFESVRKKVITLVTFVRF